MLNKDYISSLGQYLFQLSQKSHNIFWIRSPDLQRVIYVNPAYERIWGCPSQDLYDNPHQWLIYIHPDDKEQLECSLAKIILSKTPTEFQNTYRIIRPDGNIHWIQEINFPVFDDNNHIAYAGIAQDISVAKNTEEELKKELESASKFLPKLAERVENSVFWVRDPSLKNQLYLSPAFENIWGLPVSFLYKHPEKWGDTLLPEDRAKRTAISMLQLEQMLRDKAKYEDIYRIQRPDGEIRWIKDTSFAIHDQDNNCIGFTGIAQDITKEKIYEQALEEAKQAAEAAKRANSEFLAAMSHDLRTPLSVILGMVDILKPSLQTDEQKEIVASINEASHILLELVDDILSFCKLEAGKFKLRIKPFDLNQLIDDITELMSMQAMQKNLNLIISYPLHVPRHVIGDPHCVRRILINLVNNAIKFTHEGHILIAVETLAIQSNKTKLQIKVQDSGIGIPEDKLEYIFGRFNRINSSYNSHHKGTGLGLSIVKQLAEVLGGTVSVTSKLNQGSIFSLELPFKLQNIHNRTSIWQQHYPDTKILIIDDCTIRANTLLDYLAPCNGLALNSQQAEALLYSPQTIEKEFDIICIDDEIENKSAYELAQHIRNQACYDATLLILLAKPMSINEVEQSKAAGFFSYLVKPLPQAELLNSITSIRKKWQSLRLNQIENLKAYSPSILVVEDDKLTQKVMDMMLKNLGCYVTIVDTAEKAIAEFTNNYDLIFMDIGLPDKDGITATKIIRKLEPKSSKLPIVALTAHLGDNDKQKCLSAGMNDFLRKPVDHSHIMQTLTRWIFDNSDEPTAASV